MAFFSPLFALFLPLFIFDWDLVFRFHGYSTFFLSISPLPLVSNSSFTSGFVGSDVSSHTSSLANSLVAFSSSTMVLLPVFYSRSFMLVPFHHLVKKLQDLDLHRHNQCSLCRELFLWPGIHRWSSKSSVHNKTRSSKLIVYQRRCSEHNPGTDVSRPVSLIQQWRQRLSDLKVYSRLIVLWILVAREPDHCMAKIGAELWSW